MHFIVACSKTAIIPNCSNHAKKVALLHVTLLYCIALQPGSCNKIGMFLKDKKKYMYIKINLEKKLRMKKLVK